MTRASDGEGPGDDVRLYGPPQHPERPDGPTRTPCPPGASTRRAATDDPRSKYGPPQHAPGA